MKGGEIKKVYVVLVICCTGSIGLDRGCASGLSGEEGRGRLGPIASGVSTNRCGEQTVIIWARLKLLLAVANYISYGN